MYQRRTKETVLLKPKKVKRVSQNPVEQLPTCPPTTGDKIFAMDTTPNYSESEAKTENVRSEEVTTLVSMLDTAYDPDVFLEPLPNCPFGVKICSKRKTILEEAESEVTPPVSVLDPAENPDVYLEPLINCPFGAKRCSKRSLEEADSGVDPAKNQSDREQTVDSLMVEIVTLKRKLSKSEARAQLIKKKLKAAYQQIQRQSHHINKLRIAGAERAAEVEFKQRQEKALSGKRGFAYGLILNENQSVPGPLDDDSGDDDESSESAESSQNEEIMIDVETQSKPTSVADNSPEGLVADISSEEIIGEKSSEEIIEKSSEEIVADKSCDKIVGDSNLKDNLPFQMLDSNQTALTTDVNTSCKMNAKITALPPFFKPVASGSQIVHVPVVHPSGMRFLDSGKFKVAPVYLKKREILDGDIMSPMFAIKILTKP